MLGHAIYDRNHPPLPRRVVVRTVSAFAVQRLKVLQNTRRRYAHPQHGGTKSRQRRTGSNLKFSRPGISRPVHPNEKLNAAF
jgi:hypothetical protein